MGLWLNFSNLAWLTWSNPVAVWWLFLIAISAVNILFWHQLRTLIRRAAPPRGAVRLFAAETLLFLSAAYVFGCAFRSILPRADVQRICLFDTWLSNVLVGRSVATVAELCFVIQWAIVLYELGKITRSDTAKNIAWLIVPLIVGAECCSWYAVITTDFLGNVLENSLWAVTFMMIAIALIRLSFSFRGIAQAAIAATAIGVAGYVVFMSFVDVPMYAARWQAELADGAPTLGFFAGLHDLATRWVVTHDIADWRFEIPWMSLYFSVAVWTSLALGGFSLIRHRLPAYRVRRPLIKPSRRPIPVPVRSS
ncbi:MAG TPA: hypothetical protein VH206_14795 [Xanthobacteraceae bacterium]|jgi:hypothetical protein|nr:hypothetical protein [Xanthobacteraceae bacterium]